MSKTTRTKKVLVAATGIGLGLLVAVGGSAGSASGSSPSPTTTTLPTPGVAVDRENATSDAARAIEGELPKGFDVRSEYAVKGERADYQAYEASDGTSAGYSVTVYRSFDPSELGGLKSLESSPGRAWVGAEDPDLTSVYYLSADGVGVRVAGSSPERKAPAVSALAEIATRIADSDAVKREAGK